MRAAALLASGLTAITFVAASALADTKLTTTYTAVCQGVGLERNSKEVDPSEVLLELEYKVTNGSLTVDKFWYNGGEMGPNAQISKPKDAKSSFVVTSSKEYHLEVAFALKETYTDIGPLIKRNIFFVSIATASVQDSETNKDRSTEFDLTGKLVCTQSTAE